MEAAAYRPPAIFGIPKFPLLIYTTFGMSGLLWIVRGVQPSRADYTDKGNGNPNKF